MRAPTVAHILVPDMVGGLKRRQKQIQVPGEKSVGEKDLVEELNGYRNKFRVSDIKHHKSWDRSNFVIWK